MGLAAVAKRKLVTQGLFTNATLAPYICRLYVENGSPYGFCGCSIIGPTTALTAAHCVSDATMMRTPLLVGIGKTYTELNTGPGEIVAVSAIISHPSYDHTDSNAVVTGSDVALLVLSSPVTSDVVLLDAGGHWPLSAPPPSDAGYVYGYGAARVGGPQSAVLQNTHVRLYTKPDCEYLLQFTMTSTMGCAWYQGADACTGDSGGPLVVYDRGRVIQVGIVSFGVTECGYLPGVYVRTEVVEPFIRTYAPQVTFAPWSATSPPPATCGDSYCATDCVSNGVDVSPNCGCSDFGSGSLPYCYTPGLACAFDAYSRVYPGAVWGFCRLGEDNKTYQSFRPSQPPATPPAAAGTLPNTPPWSPPPPATPPRPPLVPRTEDDPSGPSVALPLIVSGGVAAFLLIALCVGVWAVRRTMLRSVRRKAETVVEGVIEVANLEGRRD